MVFKIVLLFLVAMGLLAWFGKMHWLGGKRLSRTKCRDCGRYRIGKGDCACKGGR
jgi:purine-cytosine permease-like protein